MKPQLSITLFFLVLFFIPGPVWTLTDDQATLDAVQKQYEATRTFQARFIQSSFVKMMNQTQKSEGSVQIKKPGKMKWVYKAPDPQILVSNEKTLWLYVPDEQQVTVMPMDNVYSTNTPALFLAGKGKLAEAFDVVQVIRQPDQTLVVLAPKEEDHSLDRLVLYVDPSNYQILGSSVYDKLGNKTEIRFKNIEVNVEIPEDTFRFKVPEGVELLDYTSTPQTNH